jgi:hypothetical protein
MNRLRTELMNGIMKSATKTKQDNKTVPPMTRRSALGFVGGGALMATMVPTIPALASSHMDAPLITLDPAANTTDVYAFVTKPSRSGGPNTLTVALAVYPFEQPGIGPNIFGFADEVTYDIHVALDNNIALGRPNLTYRFNFRTQFANPQTILPFLGTLQPNGPGNFPVNQNYRQTYTVTLLSSLFPGLPIELGSGFIVPPNNQGLVTPFYNQNQNGDMPAMSGVSNPNLLDPYTQNTIFTTQRGYRVFAGQRDDGFYADIQSIFDLDFSFGLKTGTPTKPYDSQAGFNVHTIVLEIPLTELYGAKMAGVYATTSRPNGLGGLRQVGRQGNPLFCEALVAAVDKDRYNETTPDVDAVIFAKYAQSPLLDSILGLPPANLTSIFIPDLIKVDLTTPPAQLIGAPGSTFNRLSVFGGDTLPSAAQGKAVAGGWPNGRRFGDDVVNIALIALGAAPASPTVDVDRVHGNDELYNSVFPYAGTPQNGRNHTANGSIPPAPQVTGN